MKTHLLKSLVLLTVILTAFATTEGAITLTLTGDEAHTTEPLPGNGPKGDALAATLNDPFAYNPASPTSPTAYSAHQSPPLPLTGFHGNVGTVTLAYTWSEGPLDKLFFDLYTRNNFNDAPHFRGDGTIALYNGDWTTVVFTSPAFDATDATPYVRVTAPASVIADRLIITGAASYFTLMEIRANTVPEPTALCASAALGALTLLRRRRHRD